MRGLAIAGDLEHGPFLPVHSILQTASVDLTTPIPSAQNTVRESPGVLSAFVSLYKENKYLLTISMKQAIG